jgi:hypothetical protein
MQKPSQPFGIASRGFAMRLLKKERSENVLLFKKREKRLLPDMP